MNKAEKLKRVADARKSEVDWTTRATLWWLRNFEGIIHFWTGFSWLVVIGAILTVIAGRFDLKQVLVFIFFFGFIANTTLYFVIKSVAVCLRYMEEGPEKEEAHDLMIGIIRRRLFR